MTLPAPTRDRFGVLSVPGFARLLLCSTADAWAVFLLPVAVTLHLLQTGHGATGLGLVLAAKTIGYLVATFPAGVLADHYPRARVVAVSCLARLLATGLLLLLIDGPLWLVAVCVFVVGAGEGTLRPTQMAMLGDLVPEDRRQSAIALTTITFRIALVLSPGLATALTLWSGPRTVLGVSMILWACAAYAAHALPTIGPENGTDSRKSEPARAKLLGGVRAARTQPWFLGGLAVLALVLGVSDASQMVLLPVISQDRFGTESVYALSLSAFALGALAGGLLMLRWRPPRPGLFALPGIGLIGVIPCVLAFSFHPWPVYAAHFAAGVGMEVFNVAWFAAIQREFAPEVRARVSSLDFLVSFAISPLSLAVVPTAVSGLGMRPVLITMGALVAAGCLGALAVPGMTRFRRLGPARSQ
ncbi:MFS transporter [Streptomyces sp. NPDC088755]|uniref:MFS transporter n=1 Tax=Streptomyces sp. NPDC088755 TaxID=3365888 RepID=UPI0037F3F94F